MEDHFPIYDDDGEEILSFPNVWRETQPQQVVGADCFVLDAPISNDENTLILKLTGVQFREMFSALYCGAEISYPDRHLQIIANFLKAVHCPPEMEDEGGCINYKPYASFISYEPVNPYVDPETIPEGYINQPFHVNSDFAYPELLGYQSTDVLVPVDAIPVFGDWGDLLGLHFPTIKLHVVGQGQVELDLLAVPFGGQVIIKIGSAPNIIDIIDGIIETGVKIVDLNQDTIAIPPESDLVIAEEIDIDAPEGTDIYLTFVPKIDAATEFFGMGGGIRQIGLCGLEMDAVVAGIEDIRLTNPDGTNYFLEKKVAGEWVLVVDWDSFNGLLNNTRDNAIRGATIAESLYTASVEADDWVIDGVNYSFENSPLREWIDANDDVGTFDPSDLESAIAAAQADADAAAAAAAAAAVTAAGAVATNATQATAITAIQAVNTTQNTRLTTLEADMAIAQADILATDARVDILAHGGVWSWEHDFTAAGIYTATIGSWNSGFGWNSVGQELDMHYALISPRQNQITHLCIEVISNNMSAPVLEWSISGLGLSDDWLTIQWQGVGAINKCWMRFPNFNFPIGDMRLKVRIDTGSFTVRKMTYLGRGENIPLA